MKEDKTIITFGSDDPEVSVKNNFTMDVDIPAPVPKPVEKAPAKPIETASSVKILDAATNAENNNVGSAETPSLEKKKVAPAQPRKPREPQYVTRSFLLVCMLITMLISTALGAGIGLAFNHSDSGTQTTHDKNLSESDLSAATGSELTISEINDMNEDAVVEIVVSGTARGMFGQLEMTQGAGSGVIVNKNGFIVTNYHVIDGANKVQVTLHNGDSYKASIVGGDYDNDIAVLKINAKDLKVAKIGDSSKVDVGDLAVAIGNPLGQLGGTCTQGIISALDRRLTIDDRTLTLLQTDSAINPGNSGGGLFNGKGELIGIVESKSSGTGIEGLGFAIPINTVKSEISDLIENGKVSGKPSIGITVCDVSKDNAQYYNLDQAGVYITEVTGDNATKAGFKPEDRIISINGKDVESASDLVQRVRSCKVGDIVTVKISRDGQEIDVKTELEESVETTD